MADENVYITGTGRRKEAVAKVRMVEGKGIIRINNRAYDDFFTIPRLVQLVIDPLVATSTRNDYDISISVHGGGPSGQAGAILHGISRALAKVDRAYQVELRHRGMLTRDSRMVERKKAGCHKARRGKQFSKR